MTSNRFFVHSHQIKGIFICLDGDEHHHLSRVARVKRGDFIQLFDDSGREFSGNVERLEKNRTIIKIVKKAEAKRDKVKIFLAQAFIKPKNMDFIIKKAAELGAYSFLPLISERCIAKPGEKILLKMRRWEKIALEASKQSERAKVCRIENPASIEDILKNSRAELKLLLSESSKRDKLLKDILMEPLISKKKTNTIPSSVLLIVGPEGGWTEAEQNYMIDSGCTVISLGRYILRSETAAVTSLAMISHFWNE